MSYNSYRELCDDVLNICKLILYAYIIVIVKKPSLTNKRLIKILNEILRKLVRYMCDNFIKIIATKMTYNNLNSFVNRRFKGFQLPFFYIPTYINIQHPITL